MTRNLRSKRTAESRTTKSPEPKRQSTGPTDLIQKTRTARQKTAPGFKVLFQRYFKFIFMSLLFSVGNLISNTRFSYNQK